MMVWGFKDWKETEGRRTMKDDFKDEGTIHCRERERDPVRWQPQMAQCQKVLLLKQDNHFKYNYCNIKYALIAQWLYLKLNKAHCDQSNLSWFTSQQETSAHNSIKDVHLRCLSHSLGLVSLVNGATVLISRIPATALKQQHEAHLVHMTFLTVES